MPSSTTATTKRRASGSKKKPTTRKKKDAALRAGVRKGDKRRPIVAEDLHELRFVGSPRVSPDGSQIVFFRKHVGEKNDYVTNLWLGPADGSAEPRQFTSSNKATSPRWSPDGSQIIYIDSRDKGKPQLYTINVGGGEGRKLTNFPAGTIRDFRIAPDGSTIAVAFRETAPQWTEEAKKQREEKGLTEPPRVIDDWWYRLDGDGYFEAQRFHLHIVDVETGDHRSIYSRDTMGYFDFDFAPDSQRLVIATNRDRRAMVRPWKTKLQIIDVGNGRATAIPDLPDGPKSAVNWSPDGRYIAFAGRAGGVDSEYSTENLELWICEPEKGNARSLTGHTDYCLMAAALSDTAEVSFAPNFCWTPDSKRLLMKLGWHGECHIASVERSGGDVQFLTSGQYDYDLGNLSKDGSTIALTRAAFTHPPEVYSGKVGKAKIAPKQLTSFNDPWRENVTLSEPTSHWVTTDDGTKVQVWVMMPPAAEKNTKKKFPAVLEIHGGPHAQYGVGFFHEFQVLASAGYIVFFSNPRGSKGYGRDHCAAIRGNWGSADWVDVQAVTDFMKNHSSVNTSRMAVMGGSYGGYMTNWVIGHTNEFAAAITDRCVSNLVSMGGSSDYIEDADHYFPGNFWDKPEPRWNSSPIRLMGNAKTPTLIIHSEGDLRCNIEQAEQVFAALKLNNVETRFVRYPRSTSHGMSRGGPPDMRVHRLHQILGWLDMYLKK